MRKIFFYLLDNWFICSSSCWFLVMSSVSIDRKGWKTHVAMWLFSSSRDPVHGHLISADGHGTCTLEHTLLVWSLKLPRCNPVFPQNIHLTGRRSSMLRTVRLAFIRLSTDSDSWRHVGHSGFPLSIHLVIHFRQNVWSHGVHNGSLKGALQIIHISSRSIDVSSIYL
jgi:hypothetical protein